MIDAIRELRPPLLGTLDRVVWVQRHLYAGDENPAILDWFAAGAP